MITKIRLKVKGHEEKTFMAEVEQTRQGYKFTMPDGSGIEIYGNLIENIQNGKQCPIYNTCIQRK